MRYHWQRAEWPDFTWNSVQLQEIVTRFALRMERVKAVLAAFDPATEEGKRLEAMVAEAVSTSAIEGEVLNPAEVLSSLKNRLGQNARPIAVRDYRAAGIAAMLLRVRDEYEQPLTEQMLGDWHRLLFDGYPVREAPAEIGGYRQDAIYVKSGALDQEEIRYEAPPAPQVARDMQRFVHWVNRTRDDATAPVIRAAVAHLYFESIHPFSDGNGRLGRALVSKIVAQHAGTFVMIPFSVGLFAYRKGYYTALHAASFTLDATEWIKTFGGMLENSLHSYEEELAFQIRVLCLLSGLAEPLLQRQRKVMDRMAREGAKGFTGGMSAAKYLKIAGTSKATATRDLAELTRLGLLVRRGKGTAVRYDIPSNKQPPISCRKPRVFCLENGSGGWI